MKQVIYVKEINRIEIVDGAYYSDEIKQQALEKGIEIHPTELVGKKPEDNNLLDFKIDENTHQVSACPNGIAPISSTYNENDNKIVAKFNKCDCATCPLKDKCAIDTKPKKTNTLRTSLSEINNQKQRTIMSDNPAYQELSNSRAAIEGVMSTLRRRYHIDTRSIKGLFYLKMEFSTAILSMNIKRASKMANCACQNIDILQENIFKLFFSRIRLVFVGTCN